MGQPFEKSNRRSIRSGSLRTLSVALALFFSAGSYGAFELRSSKPESLEAPSPLFDKAEYEVWVDHTYSAVVEYGSREVLGSAPSYGDPMPLEDALSLLVPSKWKVLKSRELARKGSFEVTWDVENAHWLDVLKNLGERNGLRFHVDHSKREVFVQNGRKLIFDRAFVQKGQGAQENVKTAETLAEAKLNSTTVAKGIPLKKNVTFSVSKGENAEKVIGDLANLLGYRNAYWMMDRKIINRDSTWKGEPMEVLSSAAREVSSRVCLYQADSSVAFVAKSMECPR